MKYFDNMINKLRLYKTCRTCNQQLGNFFFCKYTENIHKNWLHTKRLYCALLSGRIHKKLIIWVVKGQQNSRKTRMRDFPLYVLLYLLNYNPVNIWLMQNTYKIKIPKTRQRKTVKKEINVWNKKRIQRYSKGANYVLLWLTSYQGILKCWENWQIPQ